MNKITQFVEEYNKWQKAGKPLRSPERVKEIFSICSSCEFYNKTTEVRGKRGICGCNIKQSGTMMNKIAWGSTRCPLEEPKWIEESIEKTTAAPPEIAKEVKKSGCGCKG